MSNARELIAQAIHDRLADWGTATRDDEGNPDGGIWLDGLDAVADDLAGVALDALTESRRTDLPAPIYDDDTDDPADARRYLSGSCWADNCGECTDRACEHDCGHEAVDHRPTV